MNSLYGLEERSAKKNGQTNASGRMKPVQYSMPIPSNWSKRIRNQCTMVYSQASRLSSCLCYWKCRAGPNSKQQQRAFVRWFQDDSGCWISQPSSKETECSIGPKRWLWIWRSCQLTNNGRALVQERTWQCMGNCTRWQRYCSLHKLGLVWRKSSSKS